MDARCGNAEKGYPSLKRVSPGDFSNMTNRKRFSDFDSVAMAGIEDCECEPFLYEICMAQHSKSRDRGKWRFSHLSWMTNIDKVRNFRSDSLSEALFQRVYMFGNDYDCLMGHSCRLGNTFTE
eukprot:757512-Hanusia_phi.AAC.1